MSKSKKLLDARATCIEEAARKEQLKQLALDALKLELLGQVIDPDTVDTENIWVRDTSRFASVSIDLRPAGYKRMAYAEHQISVRFEFIGESISHVENLAEAVAQFQIPDMWEPDQGGDIPPFAESTDAQLIVDRLTDIAKVLARLDDTLARIGGLG